MADRFYNIAKERRSDIAAVFDGAQEKVGTLMTDISIEMAGVNKNSPSPFR